MTHNHENITMMDPTTTKYGKTTFVTVTKTLAIILVVIFFICLIATGLLVYSFTACSHNETFFANNSNLSSIGEPTAQSRVQVICDKNSISTNDLSNKVIIEVASSTAATTLKTARPANVNTAKDIRLTTDIVPDTYWISLIPFIQEGNFTFIGEETILINVTTDSTSITMHADTLTIDATRVSNLNNESISVRDVRFNTEKEFLIIDLDGILQAGQQYYVYLKFKGILNNMLKGFYRSSYVENNVTRWIAATQFQATDARKAFPCFDEPSFKAKFQINLARMRNMTAISNMPKVNTSENVEGLPEYVFDHFEESLPMSTYLVAFVVSDFKNISRDRVSVWARPSALSQARFALEVAPLILKHYEEFFQIPYPLPKIDMVAIPDFSAGAMENWGLITYSESVLLYQKGVSSTVSKQRIAHVIAHELAHQWFGNLVTPVWWEDLWLNEGFATYVEFLGSNSVNPKWKDLELFVVNELQVSLDLDALKTSHPISVKVGHPNEINDIFDSISYSKGAAIIRMMQDYLGESVFSSGLKQYLHKRMYKNAEQDDLWQSMTEQSQNKSVLPENVTVKEIMDTWTLQTGYPVIIAERQANKVDLNLRQERYFLNNENSQNDETLWWVPITIMDSMKNKNRLWLKKERSIIVQDAVREDLPWYLVNFRQSGYYRVNYDDRNWNALISQLLGNGHILIEPRNRAQMIDDALNLAYVGYLDYGIALNVTLYLVNEREFVPWKAAIQNFKFLHSMFSRSASFDKYKRYLLSLLKDHYLELTFKEKPDDEPTRVLSRMEIVEYACELGLKECVLQAIQLFQNWRNSANPDKENVINPDLREVVYCTAIRDGGQDEWDFAWNRYLNTNVASDKEILLNALSCSKEIWILSRFLEWSITDNSAIRKHDTARVFASIAENPVGRDLAYKFLKVNWSRIREYLGSTSMFMSSIISYTTNNFNTEEEVNDFKSFFEKRRDEFGIALRTAQQSIEQAEANIKWMKQYFHIVRKWLEDVQI
ncbi:aminopeptidase Ey-like [Anthonomus grandis grandis]|uniref:aminopeptidase Ey-like n=1 Tax=Anthonomus grandis grandis TaxID=2921223 RepID=UPI002165BB0D|nr:aminopeptidase Ey-like [Anthonomus grandis grandis]